MSTPATRLTRNRAKAQAPEFLHLDTKGDPARGTGIPKEDAVREDGVESSTDKQLSTNAPTHHPSADGHPSATAVSGLVLPSEGSTNLATTVAVTHRPAELSAVGELSADKPATDVAPPVNGHGGGPSGQSTRARGGAPSVKSTRGRGGTPRGLSASSRGRGAQRSRPRGKGRGGGRGGPLPSFLVPAQGPPPFSTQDISAMDVNTLEAEIMKERMHLQWEAQQTGRTVDPEERTDREQALRAKFLSMVGLSLEEAERSTTKANPRYVDPGSSPEGELEGTPEAIERPPPPPPVSPRGIPNRGRRSSPTSNPPMRRVTPRASRPTSPLPADGPSAGPNEAADRADAPVPAPASIATPAPPSTLQPAAVTPPALQPSAAVPPPASAHVPAPAPPASALDPALAPTSAHVPAPAPPAPAANPALALVPPAADPEVASTGSNASNGPPLFLASWDDQEQPEASESTLLGEEKPWLEGEDESEDWAVVAVDDEGTVHVYNKGPLTKEEREELREIVREFEGKLEVLGRKYNRPFATYFRHAQVVFKLSRKPNLWNLFVKQWCVDNPRGDDDLAALRTRFLAAYCEKVGAMTQAQKDEYRESLLRWNEEYDKQNAKLLAQEGDGYKIMLQARLEFEELARYYYNTHEVCFFGGQVSLRAGDHIAKQANTWWGPTKVLKAYLDQSGSNTAGALDSLAAIALSQRDASMRLNDFDKAGLNMYLGKAMDTLRSRVSELLRRWQNEGLKKNYDHIQWKALPMYLVDARLEIRCWPKGARRMTQDSKVIMNHRPSMEALLEPLYDHFGKHVPEQERLRIVRMATPDRLTADDPTKEKEWNDTAIWYDDDDKPIMRVSDAKREARQHKQELDAQRVVRVKKAEDADALRPKDEDATSTRDAEETLSNAGSEGVSGGRDTQPDEKERNSAGSRKRKRAAPRTNRAASESRPKKRGRHAEPKSKTVKGKATKRNAEDVGTGREAESSGARAGSSKKRKRQESSDEASADESTSAPSTLEWREEEEEDQMRHSRPRNKRPRQVGGNAFAEAVGDNENSGGEDTALGRTGYPMPAGSRATSAAPSFVPGVHRSVSVIPDGYRNARPIPGSSSLAASTQQTAHHNARYAAQQNERAPASATVALRLPSTGASSSLAGAMGQPIPPHAQSRHPATSAHPARPPSRGSSSALAGALDLPQHSHPSSSSHAVRPPSRGNSSALAGAMTQPQLSRAQWTPHTTRPPSRATSSAVGGGIAHHQPTLVPRGQVSAFAPSRSVWPDMRNGMGGRNGPVAAPARASPAPEGTDRYGPWNATSAMSVASLGAIAEEQESTHYSASLGTVDSFDGHDDVRTQDQVTYPNYDYDAARSQGGSHGVGGYYEYDGTQSVYYDDEPQQDHVPSMYDTAHPHPGQDYHDAIATGAPTPPAGHPYGMQRMSAEPMAQTEQQAFAINPYPSRTHTALPPRQPPQRVHYQQMRGYAAPAVPRNAPAQAWSDGYIGSTGITQAYQGGAHDEQWHVDEQ